jgi:signal transduction histidine kinase/CheY-like chemotaxis protein/HAMP domain-containing protein
MKISYRILLINFAVVVAILTSSAVVIYSVMYNIVTAQQSKYIANAANSFLYNYRSFIEECEEEFILLENNNFSYISGEPKHLDFIFLTRSNNLTEILYSDSNVILSGNTFTVDNFISTNPYAFIKTAGSGDTVFHFGRIIDEDALNIFSRNIGSEVALILNNSASEVSNSQVNNKYLFLLNRFYSDTQKEKKPEVINGEEDTEDIVATKYVPGEENGVYSKLQFVIFSKISDSDFITGFTSILILIALTGVVLSLILTMIFTDKIRRQVKRLSSATRVIARGDFNQKLNIDSRDELGQLGTAFNTMLDVLAKNEQVKNEYADFITLLNQNPSLLQISEAALVNIIRTCGYTAGVLYLVEEEKFEKISAHGVNMKIIDDPEYFRKVVREKQILELNPAESSFKNILLVPIIYNNKVIALIELGSVTRPSVSAREYLSRIQEQLAVGITNALALVQLENLVTELKNLNEDYHKQNEQVTRQNKTLLELHRELQEKAGELAAQKEKAEGATKLKSQFLASMSHELRTPMNSILGLTELILEESSLIGKNRERLEVVLKSGKRLMSLINGILDLSKIEAGKMEIHEEDILLEEIISEVETSVSPLIRHKNLEFRIDRTCNTNIMITTDRSKVIQVLINLLGNAIKFTERGWVELAVFMSPEDMLEFRISDTGVGISESDQKIIFQEFRQADGTTARKFDGTGLGLAISSRICNLLNGSISLTSKLGEGSTFNVKIQVKRSSKPVPGNGLPYNLEILVKNRKNPILVIDDDEEIRSTIGQYLNSKGYEVVFADNGLKGIREAVRLQPFAITLDLMLPDSEGWTTLKELKENPETKDIPVILVSILGDKKVGYGLGAFEYFIKPIAREEFLSALKKWRILPRRGLKELLIVDDDELEFEKFRREFKNEKIRIHYIKDSELAFSKILEIQPDLADY